jgi:predicted phage-related endonuclease
MKRGIRLEPKARRRYEELTGFEMPAVRMVHPKKEFIRVNADGANFHLGRAAEYKCPGRADHLLAIRGEVPPKYIFQLVHTLYVLDFDVIDYFSYYNDENVARVEFRRNKALERKLIPEEERLWEHVMNDTPPEAPRRREREVFQVRNSSPTSISDVLSRGRRALPANVIPFRGGR